MNNLSEYLRQAATQLAAEMAASHSVWHDEVFPPEKPRTFTPTKLPDPPESDGPQMIAPPSFRKFMELAVRGADGLLGDEVMAKRAAEQGLGSGDMLAKGKMRVEKDGDWEYHHEGDELVQQIDMRTGDRYDGKTGELLEKHHLLAKNSDPPPKHTGALGKIFAAEDPRDEITPWSIQAGRRW
jgi:hypothetical protein